VTPSLHDQQASELTVKAGPSGWVVVSGSDLPTCYVRFALSDEVWRPTTLFRAPLTPEFVRGFPMYRIEAAVNAGGVSETLASLLDAPVAGLGSEEFIRSFTGFGHVPAPPLPPITLERPQGRRLTDEWYAEVATAYRLAADRGLKPRKTIAEAAGASADVAGRWIYEARKRGLLPATQPGRVFARSMTDRGVSSGDN